MQFLSSFRVRVIAVILALGVLVLLAPKDCVIAMRFPGPDDTRCGSLVGFNWPNRAVAYLVLGVFALGICLGLFASRRKP